MVIEVAGSNAQQIEFWNGEAGAAWARNQAVLDQMIDPLGNLAIKAARLQAGDRVLDVGCGCGSSSIEIARLGGKVTGVDISEPMLAVAMGRAAATGASVDFRLADAGTIEFADEFALIFSRFGVMFFQDPMASFSNLRSVLADQGQLCFICWRSPVENPWITVPMAAAAPYLPPSPPSDPRAPGPFAFADREYVHGLLVGAGFSNINIEPTDYQLGIGDSADIDQAMDFYAHVGPLASLFAAIENDNERDAALSAVRAAITPHMTDTGLKLGSACWLVTADRYF